MTFKRRGESGARPAFRRTARVFVYAVHKYYLTAGRPPKRRSINFFFPPVITGRESRRRPVSKNGRIDVEFNVPRTTLNVRVHICVCIYIYYYYNAKNTVIIVVGRLRLSPGH